MPSSVQSQVIAVSAASSISSVKVTSASVELPVFDAVKSYLISKPGLASAEEIFVTDAFFVTAQDAICPSFVSASSFDETSVSSGSLAVTFAVLITIPLLISS